MRTIEVNLIGDLKQKYISSKINPISQSIAEKTSSPEEAKRMMILYVGGGSAGFVFISAVLIAIIALIAAFVMDQTKENTITKIDETSNKLVIATKIKKNKINYKKEILFKKAIKDYITRESFPMGSVLEEIQAKIPKELTLTNITKAKQGVLIQGKINTIANNQLEPVSFFASNLNNYKPEVSILKNAVIVSSVNQEEGPVFSIRTDIPTIEDDKSKDKDSKKN